MYVLAILVHGIDSGRHIMRHCRAGQLILKISVNSIAALQFYQFTGIVVYLTGPGVKGLPLSDSLILGLGCNSFK